MEGGILEVYDILDPKRPTYPNPGYEGFHIRNDNYGVGYIPSIRVLGPLGVGFLL